MKMSILVVDDETDIGEALQTVLGLEGHTVEVALERQTALEFALKNSPDVILMDYRMPGLGLADFVTQLRAGNCQSCIVLMTGAEKAVSEARALGIEQVLIKPFEIDQLVSMLKRVSQPV